MEKDLIQTTAIRDNLSSQKNSTRGNGRLDYLQAELVRSSVNYDLQLAKSSVMLARFKIEKFYQTEKAAEKELGKE